MIERGGESFKYKKDVMARFKELKSQVTIGVPVSHPFLLDVYQRSPNVHFKLHHIIYRRVPGVGDIHAYGYGLDGQQTDNPIKHKYGTTGVNPEQEAIKHLRDNVADQAAEFRLHRLGDVCDHCESRTGVDADHIRPFRKIVMDWLDDEGVALSELEFAGFNQGNRLIPDDLHASWTLFHLEECDWQWLCKPCHVLKTRGDNHD